MTFGERLRNFREQRGMTQQTLADRLHVTRQAVSRWENEARYPDIFTVKQIADILGTSMDELMGEDADELMDGDAGDAGEEAGDAGIGGAEASATKKPAPFVTRKGSKVFLITFYGITAFFYFLDGAMGILGSVPDLMLSERLLSEPGVSIMLWGNLLCNLINFAVMAAGVCFCAADSLRPGTAGAIAGIHYAAYTLSMLGTLVFILDRGAAVSPAAMLHPLLDLILFCPLTLYYFCSGKRVPYPLLFLPAAAVLLAMAENMRVLLMVGLSGGSAADILGNLPRMASRVLVQILILYQGYLLKRMRRK